MSSQKSILLIEDNPSDIDLTRRALERGGVNAELIVADDGERALDYLLGTGAHAHRDVSMLPALALLDLKLPRVPGLEVLRRIREDVRTRRLPVVILTSSVEERDLAGAYDLGVNSYIRKPVDYREFQFTIEQLGLYWLVLNEPAPAVKQV